MPRFTKCDQCAGSGSLKCSACVCRSCAGRGSSPCSQCSSGRIGCSECSATGQMPCKSCSGLGRTAEHFWFIKWSTRCSTCGGAARQECATCAGAKTVPCRNCGATGLIPCGVCGKTGVTAACTQCGGSRALRCSGCSGAGQLETEWSRQLDSSSIEWLRLEHERLLRRIAELETRRAEVIREEKELSTATSYHALNTRDYSDSEWQRDKDMLAHLRRESERYFEEILSATSDSGEIQGVLSRKLR
jgi:hypothetical protein